MDEHLKTNFLKGSLLTASGAIISAAFHILSIMLIARNVPRDDFGVYALIIALASFLTILAGMGLDLTLTKYVSEEKSSSTGTMLLPITVMRAITLSATCIITYLCSSLISLMFKVQLSEYILWLLAICIAGSFRDLLLHLLQGLRLFKQYASLNIFTSIIKFSAIALFIRLGPMTLKTIIGIEAGTALLTVAFAFILIFASGVRFNYKFSNTSFKEILKFTMPLYANNILTVLHARMGVFMLSAMSGPTGVALYDVAGKIPDGCLKLFRAFITVYFPNQSMLFSAGKKKEAVSIMNKSLGVVSAVILTLVLFSFLFQGETVKFIFSGKYAQSAFAFALLMLNFYMRTIVNIMGYSLVSAGFSSVPMKVNAVACVLNIFANLILIPIFGFMGAVYALLFMTSASQLMFGYHLAKAGLLVERERTLVPALLLIAIGAICLPCATASTFARLLMVGLYFVLSCCFIRELRSVSAVMLSKCIATATSYIFGI